MDHLIGTIVKVVIDILRECLKDSGAHCDDIEPSMADHLRMIAKWSNQIQMFGMTESHTTDETTVPLELTDLPRKFGSPDQAGFDVDEMALLAEEGHSIVLGDPGSGKTTLLKRLARILLSCDASDENDKTQFPLLVSLKNLNGPVLPHIASIMGIPVKRKTITKSDGLPPEVLYFIGDKALDSILPGLLEKAKPLILLDGLDEARPAIRRDIEKELSRMALSLTETKIVLTCRSGDFDRSLDGFTIREIRPLDNDQIREVSVKCARNAEAFLSQLRLLPYQDTCSRPLLLMQLIVLFNNQGRLPEQPIHVCRRLLALLLEDWDSQRDIERGSRYAHFAPDQKFDFLAAIAHQLTWVIKASRFTTSQLTEAYANVCERFALPAGEATEVAREIESHTGIVITSGYDGYEFSHLSMQEYLCAYHLVREAQPTNISQYLAEYTPPLAVAVALSSNPSNWFSLIFLREKGYDAVSAATLNAFLSRLMLEKPMLDSSPLLGIAVLSLMFRFRRANERWLYKVFDVFLNQGPVKRALVRGLQWYVVAEEDDRRGLVKLSRRMGMLNYMGLEIPPGGFLEGDFLKQVMEQHGLALVQTIHEGKRVKAFSPGS